MFTGFRQMQQDHIAAVYRIDCPQMLPVPRDAVRHRLEPLDHLCRDTRIFPQIRPERHITGAADVYLQPAHGFRAFFRGFTSGNSSYIAGISASSSARSSGSETSSIGFAPS